MHTRLIALVLAGLAFSLSARGEDVPQPQHVVRMGLPAPQSTGEASRVALAVTAGLPVIEATVNGKGPFKFAVDTGASGQVHLSEALASKLALVKVGEARAADGSGKNIKHVPLYRIDAVAVGGVAFSGVTAAGSNPRTGVIDGVIGMGLLQDFVLTIDYPGKALRLDKGELPIADGKSVFDYQPARVIIVPVKVGDVEIPTHLDTGNSRHPFIVSADLVPKLSTRGGARAIGQAHTISNTVDMFAVDVTAPVRIGDVMLPIKEISYPTVAPGGNLGTLGLLGVVLRVDQKNHRVSFTAP